MLVGCGAKDVGESPGGRAAHASSTHVSFQPARGRRGRIMSIAATATINATVQKVGASRV
jgi:hypothetical protein